jgi:hypothetical protein
MNRHRTSKLAAITSTVALTATLAAVDAGPAAADDGAPEAPSNLRATDLAPERITVTWDPVAGASEYKVTVVPLEPFDGYTRLETDDPTVTLDDLTWDVPYKVTVRAFVPSAYPNWYTETSTITATTPLPDGYTPPSAPTGLRVERDSRGQITLVRWDAAEGFGPLSYQLHLDSPDFPGMTGVWARTTRTSFDASLLPISGGILGPGQSVSLWVTATDQIRTRSPASERLTLTCCPL